MQKFASLLIKKPILLKQERALVGVADDLIIDPDTGELAGILVREGFGKRNIKTIANKDIVGIGSNFFLVDSYSVLGDIDEIVRIKQILDRDVKIIKNKVFTVSGKYLGRVYDYTLDLTAGRLSRLYIRTNSLNFLSSDLIIARKQIISIEKERIVVDDAVVKLKPRMKVVPKPEAI